MEWNNSHQLLCKHRQQKAAVKSHPLCFKELIIRKHAEVVWVLEIAFMKRGHYNYYLTRKIIMFTGSYAPASMKWCFNHPVTTLLVFLVIRTRILHSVLHISQKKNLQETRTAVIYSLIRRRKKINLWSVQCNKHCLFVHQTVELPSPKVRNYSHIFLFIPTSIEQ